MCISAATASLILSGVSAAASFVGQSQSASAQAAYQAQQEANAADARRREQQLISQRQIQERDATTRQKNQNASEAAAKRSEIAVSAVSANMAGNSVFNLIRDVYRQEGQNADALTLQNDMTIQQLQAEKDATNATYSQRTAFAPVSRPSIFSAGLEIAGAGLNYAERQGYFKGSTTTQTR